MVQKNARNFLIIALACLVPTILIWLPFFLRLPSFWGIKLPQQGMATIIANFDGPYYIVVAKSLYNPEVLENFQFPLPATYYAAHFPGFPLLIRVFSPIFGYPWAMMVVTVISSILALWFLYLLLRQAGIERDALWITLVFAIFPARWLIVRSVGSPEPLFIAAILATYYFFLQQKYWPAAIAGAAAMTIKSPGIIVFLALLAAVLSARLPDLMIHPINTLRKMTSQIFPIMLIPATLLGIFIWFSKTYKDFFAYFHSGDNIHLLFPPFQVFNAAQTWVGTFWLEEIIWLYLFGLFGLLELIKQKRFLFAWFVGIFISSTLFVSHRDIARYILPIVPFLLIAFSNLLATPQFRWIFIFLAIPIYLFSINFIINNVTPVADWGPLL